MFFSKSTLFSIATASMFVANAWAIDLVLKSYGHIPISARRQLSTNTKVEYDIPEQLQAALDPIGGDATKFVCDVEAIVLDFGFAVDTKLTSISLELEAFFQGGGGAETIEVADAGPVDFKKDFAYEIKSTDEFINLPVPFDGAPGAQVFYSTGLHAALTVTKKLDIVPWFLNIESSDPITLKAPLLELEIKCEKNVIDPNFAGSVVGDPHYTTFGNKHYDFQGACDLVTVQNNAYKNGKGMHVHTRTKSYGSWSSVVSAAVKIGDDVIEVHGEDLALINGVEYPVSATVGSEFNFPMTIGDYSLTVQILGPHSRRHIIHMGDGEKIMINNFKEFVDVSVEGVKAEDYDGAVGMLGAYSQGGAMMGRDGETVFEDADAFGQEWQVNPTDPHLFHVIDGPQYPVKCNMPEQPTAEQRHLRAMSKKVSEDDAKKACANASRKENCIADVFGSDNLEMAQIYTMGSL